jgi:hypothetical protein
MQAMQFPNQLSRLRDGDHRDQRIEIGYKGSELHEEEI